MSSVCEEALEPAAVSEARFRQLMDALPHIVWLMQADGSATWFNQKWCEYSGLSMAQSLGLGWTEQIHPDDAPKVANASQQACALGEPFEMEYRLRREDGAYRWMLARAAAQVDAGGHTKQWMGTLTDIHDLKQASELLERDLFMTRIAGRVARLGGWTIELPERKLTWSDENCRIHDVPPGYQPTLQEGIGYFNAEDRPMVTRLVEACAQHGTPYEFILPKMTAKGRRIWVRSLGEAVRDDGGNIIRLQGAFQDITEQKEAEASALALQTRLSDTLESITDGFSLMDKDWNFTFVNSQAERMLKRGRGDLQGKNLWEQFPAMVGTPVEREYRAAVKEQRSSRIEAYYRPLKTWFVFHVYPTESGTAVYFQDITERRKEQAQLRVLETAVSRSNDIVIIAKASPFHAPQAKIVFVNDAFERHTGYSRAEAMGMPPEFIWKNDSPSGEPDRVTAAIKKWQAVRTQIISNTKAGKPIWLDIDVTPIPSTSGKFTHWVAVARDITASRQQEEEIVRLNAGLEERVLLRTGELASANSELESFAYAVSHDLRSPLNTIHGFSQLLAKHDGGNLSEKGKHYLERIGVGVKQMGDLIEGMLTLAHLSQEEIKSERVDLSALARTIETSCREKEPQRRVEVNIQDGLCADGDPRLLSAVMHNLLGNAWKFTARQALAKIDVGSAPDVNGNTVFYVKDNGVGFSMAFAHKLFGTFERLHSPGDFVGNGIGLATVKRVIERHGGRVWAESKPNEGANFYFTCGPAVQPHIRG